MPEQKRAEQDKRLKDRMARIKYKFIVISGKGGAGKTTVAVNLAYSLSTALSGSSIVTIELSVIVCTESDTRLVTSPEPRVIVPAPVMSNNPLDSIPPVALRADNSLFNR